MKPENKEADIECNVITLHGWSGCGKTLLIRTLRKMCEDNGYTEERITFKEGVREGLPRITFENRFGMSDLHGCLSGYASKTHCGLIEMQ